MCSCALMNKLLTSSAVLKLKLLSIPQPDWKSQYYELFFPKCHVFSLKSEITHWILLIGMKTHFLIKYQPHEFCCCVCPGASYFIFIEEFYTEAKLKIYFGFSGVLIQIAFSCAHFWTTCSLCENMCALLWGESKQRNWFNTLEFFWI